MNMNLSYSARKNAGAISTRSAFSERLYFCSARANLGINYSSQSHSEENSHEKSYLFVGLLLGAMLSAVALSTPNVTGKWSGTLQMDGENDAKPAYSILNQDGNKLSGSVGPNESEQDSFEGGRWMVTN